MKKKIDKILQTELKKVKNVIVADYGHGLLSKKLVNTIQKKSKNWQLILN